MILAAALVIAACGSTSNSATATGSGTATASSTTTGSSASAPRAVTVCFDGETPPQEFYDTSHQPAGSEVEMLNDVASQAHWNLSFHQVQFNGIVAALLANQCDLISAGLFVKPARQKVINFVLNSINGQSLMVQKGNKAGITGYNDSLAGKAIGMPSGYATIPIVQAECASIGKSGKQPCHIVQFGNVPDTYNSLLTDKVDAVLDATSSIGYFASKNSSSFQAVDSPPVLPSNVGFGVRKNDPTLQAQLQNGMNTLYADGKYCAILKKWNIAATALPAHKC